MLSTVLFVWSVKRKLLCPCIGLPEHGWGGGEVRDGGDAGCQLQAGQPLPQAPQPSGYTAGTGPAEQVGTHSLSLPARSLGSGSSRLFALTFFRTQ